MASRSYSDRTIKLLFGRVGRCAFPDCCQPVTDHVANANIVVGEIAHICGLNPGSERHDPTLTSAQLNEYENLVVLCPTHHHAYADGAFNAYSADILRQWKSDEEAWFEKRMRDEMPRVTFTELEIVMKAMLQPPQEPTSDRTLLTPREKMRKNALTDQSGLVMGMTKVSEVRDLLQRHACIDSQFPERLRAGFVELYEKRRKEGLHGDALFLALREDASQGSRDPRMMDAALAVLTYLFEACEVFER